MNPIIEDRAIVRGGLKCGQIINGKIDKKVKRRVSAVLDEIVCISSDSFGGTLSWWLWKDLIRDFELDLPEPPKPGPKMVMLSKAQANMVKKIMNENGIEYRGYLSIDECQSVKDAIDAITDKSGDVGNE